MNHILRQLSKISAVARLCPLSPIPLLLLLTLFLPSLIMAFTITTQNDCVLVQARKYNSFFEMRKESCSFVLPDGQRHYDDCDMDRYWTKTWETPFDWSYQILVFSLKNVLTSKKSNATI
jgi:hypothetical protein